MLNAENLRDAEQRRFAWRCRRGMLELDIVLQNFVNVQFDSLNMGELQAFDDMLELPDNEFWDLINSSKQLKKTDAQATKSANEILQKLRSTRFDDILFDAQPAIATQPDIANEVKQSMASHALTNDGSPRRSAPRDDEMSQNLPEQNQEAK